MIFRCRSLRHICRIFPAVTSIMCVGVYSAYADSITSVGDENMPVFPGFCEEGNEHCGEESFSRIPSYIPDSDFNDVMSYSITVRINGKNNRYDEGESRKVIGLSGSYVVCLDTDYDNSCEDEVTRGVTDSLGYGILSWSDVTVNRNVLGDGNIIAHADDAETGELFRYPLSEINFIYDTEAEVHYDNLYLNSLSNIQNLLGRQNFNRILGVVSHVDFAQRNPEDDSVYRTIMHSFDDSNLADRGIYDISNAELSVKVNSVFNNISGKVNENEMDDIISLIINNIDGSR